MKSIFEMTGAEKAAALLVALGKEIAGEVISHLDEESIKQVTAEIAKIENLSASDREDLIGEFLIDLRKKKGVLYGGENVAREILVTSLGEKKAEAVLKKLTRKDLEKGFEFLKEIDTEFLVTLLQNEHPQTIAVTLAYLPPKKSASIIKSLLPDQAKDVAKRLATMKKTSPDAVLEIARVIKVKYENSRDSERKFEESGGIDTIVSIMNHMSGEQENRLMDHFKMTIPGIADQIKDRIFTFESILNLTNPEVRVLIDEIRDDYLIAKALKGAKDDLRFKIMRNMSRNRAVDILNDMDAMGPIRITEIEESRNAIVSIMRDLDSSSIITLKKENEKYVE